MPAEYSGFVIKKRNNSPSSSLFVETREKLQKYDHAVSTSEEAAALLD
jgi:hypothetical protein